MWGGSVFDFIIIFQRGKKTQKKKGADAYSSFSEFGIPQNRASFGGFRRP